MPEPALRCPGCGAPAAADSVACDYCGSALATVTCPSCFASMFAGSRFCAHCGAETTRELLDDATPQACPRCRAELELLRLGGTTLRSCTGCGGLWLEPAALQQLCDAHEQRAGVTSVLAARVPTGTGSPDVIRYVPCPTCAKLMNRVNFSHSSGVIVDICKQHGVWLDRGELQRVLGFVDAGGLAVARDRERERLVEEQRRLKALQTASSGSTGAPDARVSAFYSAWTPGDAPAGSSLQRLMLDALGLIMKA